MLYEETQEKFNITSFLLEECNLKKGRKDSTAIYFKEKQYTYGEVNINVNKYANYLCSLGLRRDEKIGLYMSDCPEFIFIFLGAVKAGIIPVIINAKLDFVSVNKIIGKTNIRYLYTNQNLVSDLQGSIDEKDVKLCDINDIDVSNIVSEYDGVETRKSDTAFILFTSGSSGEPKGVVHEQGSIRYAIEIAGKNVLETRPTDVFYCHSSMSFAFGLGATMYLPFAEGASTILNDDDNIYDIKEILKKYKVTHFIAVPSVYLSLIQLLNDGDDLFSNCRKFVASGEPLSKKLSEDWKKAMGKDIYSVFGQTETLHMVIANMGGAEHYGSLGKTLPGYEVKIVNENGDLVKPFEIGQMFVKGPGFMKNYWNNDELTKDTLNNGWIKTGDMVYYDQDKYLWYSGRNSDTFKVNGVWQSAIPIEEAILEQGDVIEVVVSNEINDERNSDIVAYIVPKEGVKLDEIVLGIKRIFFKKQMRVLCPKHFYFVEKFPRGNTGKVLRGKVKEAKVIEEL